MRGTSIQLRALPCALAAQAFCGAVEPGVFDGLEILGVGGDANADWTERQDGSAGLALGTMIGVTTRVLESQTSRIRHSSCVRAVVCTADEGAP